MPAGGITVSVAETGEIAVDGVATADAMALLLPQVEESPEVLIRINAHHAAELRHILPLIAELEAAGAREVALVVTPASP